MKIVVFSTHALWQPHLETETEIIQGHLDKGDTVYRFVCNGDLPTCDVNTTHALQTCIKCRKMSMTAKELLKGNVIDLPLIHESYSAKTKKPYKYNSALDLKNLYVGNFDAGVAAMSSVISWFREPVLDVNKHREVIDHCLSSSIAVYESALKYMEELEADVAYVFNGRLVHVKPVLRAAQKLGVKCYIHERGHSKDYYGLFEDTTPHDRKYVVEKMQELWDATDPEVRQEKGELFYTERAAGKSQGWYSFTDKQQKGLLPENWDAGKRNVVIFNSSEDEFASIGDDWKNELYNSQLEAISRIVKDSLQFPDLHFYLRVHPNLSNIDNSEARAIKKLSSPNLTVIEAESPISTYDLLFNCEKVLAFGSSAGIEAVYWGKPSIQAGKSYYFGMDATYKPNTHDELLKMMKDRLEPMSKTPALVYGHYFKAFGIPYRHYSAITLATGTYNGVNIDQKVAAEGSRFGRLRAHPVYKYPAYAYEKYYQKFKKVMTPGFIKNYF